MGFDNRPLLTLDEFVRHVGLLSGGAAETDTQLVTAVNQVLIGYGDNLKMRFYVTLPVPAYACELDVSTFGIDDVQNVEQSCGDGCWRDVAWFREQNHILIQERQPYERAIRIECWVGPPRATSSGDYGTLATAFDAAVGAALLNVTTVFSNGSVPPMGYVLLKNGTNTLWIEYRGITTGSTSTISLLFPAKMDWNQSPTVFPIGSTLEWGIGFHSTRSMDAAAAQAAAYYWAARTGFCESEDDRSFATQMMNFWMNEAEKKWRMVPSARKARIIRKAQLDSLLTGAY